MSNPVSPYVVHNNPQPIQPTGVDEINTDVKKPGEVAEEGEVVGIQPGGAPVQEEPAALTARLRTLILNATERHETSLDANVARAETKEVLDQLKAEIAVLRGKTDTRSTQRLQQLETLSRAMGKDLQNLCRKAAASFAELGKVKGGAVARAFIGGTFEWVPDQRDNQGKVTVRGHYTFTLPDDPKNPRLTTALREVADKVLSALNDQQELGEHLEYLYRATGCEIDGIYAMSTASMARATEINAMIRHLTGLAMDSRDKKLSPQEETEGRALMNMKAARLLPRYSLDMHGNDKVFDLLKTELAPIATAMEALKAKVLAHDASTTDTAVFANLKTQLAVARAALQQAAKEGICFEATDFDDQGAVTSRYIPEASVMKAVMTHLADVESEIVTLATQAYEQSALKIVDELLPNLMQFEAFTKVGENVLDAYLPANTIEGAKLRDRLQAINVARAEIEKLVLDALAKPQADGELRQRINLVIARIQVDLYNVGKFAGALEGALEMKAGHAFTSLDYGLIHRCRTIKDSVLRNERLYGQLLELKEKGVLSRLEKYGHHAGATLIDWGFKFGARRIELMARQRGAGEIGADSKTLLGVLDGTYGIDTYIAAKTWGVPDGMLNPELSDANLVGAEALGSGNANTVYLCTYRKADGTEQKFVFKPELPGRISLDAMGLNISHLYSDDQQVAGLNYACKKLAQALGTGSIMPEAYVGMHNGEFGLFMSVAEGVSGKDIVNRLDHNPESNAKVANDFAHLNTNVLSKNFANPKDNATLTGSLAREFSALEWNDIISGQGDRHWDNYKLDVDREHRARVVGIDNDVSFPDWRLGALKFRIEGDYFDRFAENLRSTMGIELTDALAGLNPGDRVPNPGTSSFLPGVTFAGNMTVEVDLTEHAYGLSLEEKRMLLAVKRTFGIQRAAAPQFISEPIYRKLQELNVLADNELKAELKRTLEIELTEGQLDALVARVRNSWILAQQLFARGRVKKDDEWETGQTQNEVRSDAENANAELAAITDDDEREQLLAVTYGPLLSDFLLPAHIGVPEANP